MTAQRTRNNTLRTPPADPVTGPSGDAGGGALYDKILQAFLSGLRDGELVAKVRWRLAEVYDSETVTADMLDRAEASALDMYLAEIEAEGPTSVDGDPTDRRAMTSPSNGAKGGRPKAPPHADAADRFAHEVMTGVDGLLTLRHWRGAWYAFGTCGWRERPDAEIRERVVTWLRCDDQLRPHATAHYAQSVMLNLSAHDLCGLPADLDMPCFLDTGASAQNWIAFSNGLCVNIWSYSEALAEGRKPHGHIRPVDASFFSLDFVSYAWNPEAQAHGFMRYLERVQTAEDGRQAVQRMVGLLLADATCYESFFQLYGFGCNGKTVLLDVLRALVGAHAVSFVSLDGLLARFQSWPLATSKVNICGELPTDVGRGQFHAIEGALKDCVSGGSIEVEKKGADKYTAKCRARFVMATNSLPTFFDRSDGIWRRLRIIPFMEQITDDEKDVRLAEKIIRDDLSGVAAWACEGLAAIIRAGTVADCEAGKAMKERHRLDCDHERQFLTEHYSVGKQTDRVKGRDIFERYQDWMTASGYRPCGASRFYARVEGVFPGSQLKATRIDGALVKGFEGIRERVGEAVQDD